nr:hypothetical protein Y87G2A.e - Caenorhabditis elegans [Caenorhabditis elegans]
MSELDTVIKNAEEIAIQEDEEIIEEVIEEEQVPWLGPTDVMEGQGEYYQSEELLEHEMVEYEDAEPYQSFLPIRDGAPYFSLNLPDLLSKAHQITQDTGVIVRLTSCFNKKCQRQVACGGCLYTIKDYVSDIQWNNWTCINPQCFGEIRTTPDFRDIREVHGHTANCPPPDEIQIAVRIAVYDTRLLAEFTDTPLENLYFGAVERLKIDCADGFVLFPPFEVVKSTLEDHRHNKIYRKRFEMQNLRDKQRKMNMTPDESICNVCGEEISSTNLPSQDQLISHYMYTHGRRMTIERYEFKDVNTFEQYLRELNSMGKYKFKRMGLADENMFYLCSHDDRLNKTGIGRATRLQQQSCHCTAFIRVFDWRVRWKLNNLNYEQITKKSIVSKREGATVTIDYCLEHQQHGYDLEPRHFGPRSATNSRGLPVAKDYVDYYTPEQYIREIDERRHRTQKLNDEVAAERLSIKRPVEVKNYVPPGRLRSLFGTRALAPPLAAQLAAGNTHPYVDVYGNTSRGRHLRRGPRLLGLKTNFF